MFSWPILLTWENFLWQSYRPSQVWQICRKKFFSISYQIVVQSTFERIGRKNTVLLRLIDRYVYLVSTLYYKMIGIETCHFILIDNNKLHSFCLQFICHLILSLGIANRFHREYQIKKKNHKHNTIATMGIAFESL